MSYLIEQDTREVLLSADITKLFIVLVLLIFEKTLHDFFHFSRPVIQLGGINRNGDEF